MAQKTAKVGKSASQISTGALNRRIAIQSQSTVQDSYGQPVQTWTTVYTCWANIGVQQSQLVYATSEFISKTTHRITMRWTSSVVLTPNMRIVYTDAATTITHTYNIEALMNPNEANWQIVALCYELEGNQ